MRGEPRERLHAGGARLERQARHPGPVRGQEDQAQVGAHPHGDDELSRLRIGPRPKEGKDKGEANKS